MENNKDVKNITEEKKESEVQKNEASAYGIVTGCKNLHVRKRPNVKADSIQIITEGTKLQVDKTRSTGDFYKVLINSCVEGYCMRKFIQIQ